VINPDNCVIEMERVIAEARRNNQPAYIVVPSDYALVAATAFCRAVSLDLIVTGRTSTGVIGA
jgi:TPP-dependent 2-oxoacid decarboxylase